MPPDSSPLMTHWITMEDVSRAYPPQPLADFKPKYAGTVLALAQAVFEAVPREAAMSRQRFLLALARDIAPGNLWLLETYERMPYPYCLYWPLASAFATEKAQKRRFDWLLWCDDDALFTAEDVVTLAKAAKERDAQFIAALPYDRMPPHQPSVLEDVDGQPMKWAKAPASGTYPVKLTGLVLALFRRSVFEVVPEPWFGVCAPTIGFAGIAPDYWWCLQMAKAGIKPLVCCDTNVIHSGMKTKIGRQYSEAWYADRGPFGFGQNRSTVQVVSQATGAMLIEPPIYLDGRRKDAP